MYDSLQTLQAPVTKTTAFNGAGIDLVTRTPLRGLTARFKITNYSAPTAGAVFTPAIDDSADNTTFTRIAQGTPVTCGTASAAAEIMLPFISRQRYVRAAMDLSPTTGTPAITYSVDLGNAQVP